VLIEGAFPTSGAKFVLYGGLLIHDDNWADFAGLRYVAYLNGVNGPATASDFILV
jgi:hypothetical protein